MSECDVLRRPVALVDLEAPGQVGRLAVQLLVEPVAPAADPLGDQEPGRDRVGEEANALARAADDERAGEAAEEDAAPDAEPALPDGERPPPVVGNLVPARDVVVEARADDPERDTPDRDAEDEIPVAAEPRPANPGQPDARRDREQQHQAVHVDVQRPDVDDAGRRRRDVREESRRRTRARHSARSPPDRASPGWSLRGGTCTEPRCIGRAAAARGAPPAKVRASTSGAAREADASGPPRRRSPVVPGALELLRTPALDALALGFDVEVKLCRRHLVSPFVAVVYTKVRRRSPIGSPPSGGFPDPEAAYVQSTESPGRGQGRDAKDGAAIGRPVTFGGSCARSAAPRPRVNRPSIRISSGPCCQSRTSSASRTRSSR